MKNFWVKFLCFAILCALPVCFLCGCNLFGKKKADTESEKKDPAIHTVTFYAENGTNPVTMDVLDGTVIVPPSETPIKIGYTFEGWYTNSQLTLKYNFNGKVRKDLSLYANWCDSDLRFMKAENGDYYVSGCNENATSVEIPKVYKDRKVTSIAVGAFKNCKLLTTVYMPDSILEIGENAFEGCIRLQTVTLSNNIKVIAAETFKDCTALSSVNLPSEVKTIERSAFENSGLTRISLTSAIDEIGARAFKNCTHLTNIVIPTLDGVDRSAFSGCSSVNKITTYCDDEKLIQDLLLLQISPSVAYAGEIYVWSYLASSLKTYGEYDDNVVKTIKVSSLFEVGSKDHNEIHTIASYKGNQTDVVIPSRDDNGRTISVIETSVSSGLSGVVSIVIPNSISAIEDNAFANCANLLSVKFASGSNLTSIGEGVFSSCTALESIVLPESVKNINANAFSDCKNLKKVILKDGTSIDRIEGNAFYGCTTLEEIELQGNSSIGYIAYRANGDINAFTNCRKLKKITIFGGESEAQRTCSAFSLYNFDGTIYVWDYIEQTAKTWITSTKTEVDVLNANNYFEFSDIDEDSCEVIGIKTNDLYVTVPSYANGKKVVQIANNAFASKSNIRNVVLPEKLQLIGSSAFIYCTSLEKISIPSGVTLIGSNTFDGCYALKTVVIDSADIFRYATSNMTSRLLSYAKTIYVLKSVVDSETNENEFFAALNSELIGNYYKYTV